MTTVWTQERKALARAAASSWAGVPHQNRIAVPRVGIDCINFVCEVIIAAGIMERRRLPFYDERLGALRLRNVMEDILLAHLHADALQPTESPQFGDLVVCKCGRQTNHIGIIIDGAFWHVPGRGRVGPEAWAVWQPRAQSLVRLTGVGFRNDPAALTWESIRSTLPGNVQ